METLRPVDRHTQNYLNLYLNNIETILEADLLTIFSPMWSGLVDTVKNAIELLQNRKKRIAIVLDTIGGSVEVVERLVYIIRHHYREVDFLVPDQAMSAGTVFVMAGDRIFMNYSSCLGPIDPQIEKNGRFVPAQAYLNMYKRLYKKAEEGQLNTAELVLLNSLDPGELYMFELASDLSQKLLTDWLSAHKFKDWVDESTGKPVSKTKKVQRASEIATELSNHEAWGSHGRMINRATLTAPKPSKIRLKIDNIESNQELAFALNGYVGLIKDHIQREQRGTFVHTRDYRDYLW